MTDATPNPIRYYTKELIKYIPKEAYKPATYKLLYMLIHVGIVFSMIGLLSEFSSVWMLALASILSGISVACLFLYCHELSHGTIVRAQPWYYISKLIFWSFSGIPPTMWKKVHNLSHHRHMNTYNDPDRKTFKSEDSILNRLYNIFIYPNRILRYSFTVGFAMMFYSVKHTLAVYYLEGSKPELVTYRPKYSLKDKVIIFFEYFFQVAFWFSIIYIIGGWNGWLFAICTWYIYSSLVILFIITQHLRNDVFIDTADPLLTTTSVIIPVWLDKLIDWHSYHVEHHLFPGINFDYYKEISNHIERKYPNRYNRIPLLQALKECFQKDIMIDDPLL